VTRIVNAVLIAAVVSAYPTTVLAQGRAPAQPPAASSPRISACSLMPKAEVKKHLPWEPMFDAMKVEEDPIGTSGSACSYPTVIIQVMPFSQRIIDLMREKGGLEPISGVGDEAYFRNNKDRDAELYVRTGKHLLTVQASADGKVAAVKPGVLSLGKALVARLR
jgi:hypothetical protein